MILVMIKGLVNVNVINMVKSLHEIPYGEMPKWGQTVRLLIKLKGKFDSGV